MNDMLPKGDLRQAALARRDALSDEARATKGALLAARLADLAPQLPPGPVGAYWPIRSEADPRPVTLMLQKRGHAIALPAVTPDGLVFRLWRDGEPLIPAPFGLMEPPATAPDIRPATLLVPLAAFDRRGHRIGYGKGHYDRALAGLGSALTIGLAFSVQEIPLIPDEPHDHPLDFVVTELETIHTSLTRDR